MVPLFKTYHRADFIELMGRENLDVIQQEHQEILQQNIIGTFEEASKASNSKYCRYSDKACFDHSRVILPNGLEGNFINANYVDGFECKNKFICTEGPLPSTSYNFWRMVYLHQTRIIVMLCSKEEDGKNKCDAYWSEIEGASIKCNHLVINTAKIQHYPGYVKTTLLLTGASTLEVQHFRFTQWPDYGVPADTQAFVRFLMAVRLTNEKIAQSLIWKNNGYHYFSPIVVHCSAGLGRTGAFCVADITISRFNMTGTISLGSALFYLRQQRYNTLNRLEQYFFCYRAILFYVYYAAKFGHKIVDM